MNTKIEQAVLLDPSARVGDETRIWHHSQIREDAIIGSRCVIGRNVYVGPGVQVGNDCKIQNNSLIYEPAVISEGVFIGPGVILTNDQYPRAVNPNQTLKTASDWHQVGVSIGVGASVGAGSVCVAPVQIGAWALVAAGSVVIRDVPAFALVVGNPARQIGWVGKSGHRLKEEEGCFKCPVTGDLYKLVDNVMTEADK